MCTLRLSKQHISHRNNILSLAEVQSVLNEKLAARGFGRELLDDLENFMDLLRREAQAHDSAGELTDQVLLSVSSFGCVVIVRPLLPRYHEKYIARLQKCGLST